MTRATHPSFAQMRCHVTRVTCVTAVLSLVACIAGENLDFDFAVY